MKNARLTKLAKEKTAFNNCSDDMSDVKFELGKSCYSTKIFAMIVLYAVVFCGRIFLRRHIVNPNMEMPVSDIVFWIFIGVILLYVIISTIMQSRRKSISVNGKKLCYNGGCWTSDDISYVKCTKLLERIEVFSKGKKILSFSWELDNSELFIAWVKKCGIMFDDNR
jgi:hypothetical protein